MHGRARAGFAFRQKETITFSISSFLGAISLQRLKKELTPPSRKPRRSGGGLDYTPQTEGAGLSALINNSEFSHEIEIDDTAAQTDV